MPASTRQTAVQNRNQPKKADPYPVCLFLKKGVFPLIDLLIKIFIKNHENTADPVSYTHLDVYKRQV